jgi:hypothetical protein
MDVWTVGCVEEAGLKGPKEPAASPSNINNGQTLILQRFSRPCTEMSGCGTAKVRVPFGDRRDHGNSQ